MALELALEDKVYEHLAIKFYDHFLHIAASLNSLGGNTAKGFNLWDEHDRFFYDVLHLPYGKSTALKVRSIVGIIPLFAVEVLEPEMLDQLPRFTAYIQEVRARRPDLCNLVSRWEEEGVGGRRLFSLVRGWRMTQVLERILDETEFLSEYGMRGLSKYHEKNPYEFRFNGTTHKVAYVPGESNTHMFGGNSNWRGPVWFPINYMLLESLKRFYAFYGDRFIVPHPEVEAAERIRIPQIIETLERRLVNIFALSAAGTRPVYTDFPDFFQKDPHFRDNILFYEYFHGDTGKGLGASHQTGWTGLVAELIRDLGEKP